MAADGSEKWLALSSLDTAGTGNDYSRLGAIGQSPDWFSASRAQDRKSCAVFFVQFEYIRETCYTTVNSLV
jgi:hypothetical protein